MNSGKIYFLSDTHLGSKEDFEESVAKQQFVDFLDGLGPEAEAVYLLGDIFDFWLEYKQAIPQGYDKVLISMSSAIQRGITIYFCPGNHDYWTFGYLENQIGLKVISQPYYFEKNGYRFWVAHGDGLGKTSFGVKMMNLLFKGKICIKLLLCLPSPWIYSFAHYWSRSSRKKSSQNPYVFKGENDNLYKYALGLHSNKPADFFIFGHLHQKIDLKIDRQSRFVILDSWSHGENYAVFDNGKFDVIKITGQKDTFLSDSANL